MPQEKSQDFDDQIYAVLEQTLAKAVDNGLPLAQVSEVASEAILAAIDGAAPNVARRLIETMPRMLKDHRRSQLHFERLLRIYWGRGLDLMYSVLVCAEESGREYFVRHRRTTRGSVDVIDALGAIHARSCRTAFEVHRLLSAGFALGALARCRTLHELSVTSATIETHASTPGYEDLATRFLLHHHISSYKDAMLFQSAATALGQEPFDDTEMQGMLRTRNRLVDRFGPGYSEEYGWAAPLFHRAPKFVELERLAQIGHLRPYYRWASHEIHSDSKGVHMNINERNGISYLGTGPSIEGLADPAQMAMISLHQTTTHLLLTHSTSTSPRAMLSIKSIGLLIDHVMQILSSAETAVAAHAVRDDEHDARVTVRRGPTRRTRVVRSLTRRNGQSPGPTAPTRRTSVDAENHKGGSSSNE